MAGNLKEIVLMNSDCNRILAWLTQRDNYRYKDTGRELRYPVCFGPYGPYGSILFICKRFLFYRHPLECLDWEIHRHAA